MIPGGRIQDKAGPKVGAIVGGLFLALGCIIAGLSKSYTGLIIGFGIFGGIGMGIGYAAPTPAALSWFGPHKRGLIAGLVVGGYGGAALYIAPLATYLIGAYGVASSFVILGIFFAAVVIIAGSQLAKAPPGYVAPAKVVKAGAAPAKAAGTLVDWAPSEIFKAWQFYALVFMFIGTTQSGLLVIANAAPIGTKILGASAWLLVSWGGLINALGRVGTGMYSDKIGRGNAYALNCLVSAVCSVPAAQHPRQQQRFPDVPGRGYCLLAVRRRSGADAGLSPPTSSAPRTWGMNYGLVFIGWGLGFFMTRLAGTIKDMTGTLDWAFYLSAMVLIIAVVRLLGYQAAHARGIRRSIIC